MEVCQGKSGISGVVTDHGTIELTLDEARRLKAWFMDVESCHKINELLLQGHIEKLENRLKAFN